jgi:hypothetical protein
MTAQEEAPILELDVSLSRKEYMRFVLWHASRSTSLRILFLLSIGLLSIMVILRFTGYLNRNDPKIYIYGIMVFSYWILVLAAYTVTAMTTYASSKFLHDPMHYVFSKDGITVRTPSVAGEMNWRIYHEAVETKRFFAIYSSNMLANLIPKTFFQSPAQMETFRNLLRTNMPPKTCRF